MTAMSTCMSAKYLNAIAVTTSKNEGEMDSIYDLSLSTKSTTYSSEMGCPLMRIRSLKSTRWGEV